MAVPGGVAGGVTGDSPPTELDSFIGRETELTEARGQLQDNRLVTLTGPPGVGKTRLSRYLIAREYPAFPDGVAVANLTDITGDELYHVVSSAVGVADNGSVVADRLLEFVRQHQDMLLVLDNCDDLVEDVRGLVSALLHAAPRLRILATSQIMLGARGERLLPVPPLPAEDALRLLVDRGSAVRPQWRQSLRENRTLPGDEVSAAREVCDLLEGIPLAIEMVASWLDVMTIQETVPHLHDRLRFLVAQESDQPNHRSMRAALDSTYLRLSPAAQRMWTVAATFAGGAGGFDLAAAQAVAAALPMDRHEVLTALTSLVRHSVLTTSTREGRTCYRMLETTRVYGKHPDLQQGELPDLRRAHADYFFDVIATAESDWFSPREIDWMHQLTDHLPNIRLTLDYLRHSEDRDRALQLSVLAARTRCHIFTGQIDEARRWLITGLEHYDRVDALRVEALAWAAWLSLIQGASEQARPLLAQCREAALVAGCLDTSGPLVLAEATRVWLTEPHRNQAHEAITLFTQAAQLFEANSQRGGHFTATMVGAVAACFLRDRAAATRLTRELVTQAEAAGAPWCIAWAGWTRAHLELLQDDGDLHAAMSWTQNALDMAWQMGDTLLPAWGLWLAGCIAARLGMAERAALLFGGALQRQRGARVMVEGLLPQWRVQQQAQMIALAALGEDAFADHLARGESTPYEDIMNLALKPVPGPRPDPDSPETTTEWLPRLTPREHEVADCVTQGLHNKDIAAHLGMSVRTAEVHVASLIRKLNAGTRVGVAVRYAALRRQSLPPDDPDRPGGSGTGEQDSGEFRVGQAAPEGSETHS